jgi:predicted NAD/FAD-binding protein
MKIAIIGSGISGLTLAHYLNKNHDVTLYESANRLGGHTHTHILKSSKKNIKVDSGFIVFNKKTYPNFLKLLNELKVSYQKSTMSFSVQAKDSNLTYGGSNIQALFCRPRNIINPRFLWMLLEIYRFNRIAKKLIKEPSKISKLTLRKFIKKYKFSDYFLNNYLLPMSAAIWSSNYEDIKDFSLLFFIRFLNNHGMININDRPEWLTIKGGSDTYVRKIKKNLKNIRMNTKIKTIFRKKDKTIVEIDSKKISYDHVFIACHADEALKLLSNPTNLQKNILEKFKYSENKTILHGDTTLMPKQKKAWSAWNYLVNNKSFKEVTVTYNMNILQNLTAKVNLLVSLNIKEAINPKTIIKTMSYTHPKFNFTNFKVQNKHKEICKDGISFAGAYWGNGFHEDGVVSALNAISYTNLN